MTRKQQVLFTAALHGSALIFLGLGLYFYNTEWSANTGLLHDWLGSNQGVRAFIVMLFGIAVIDAVAPFIVKKLLAKNS